MTTYVLLTLKVRPGKMAEFHRLDKLVREQEQPAWSKYGAKLLGIWEVAPGEKYEIPKSLPGFHKLGEVHKSEGDEVIVLFSYEDINKRRLAYEENSKKEKLQKLLVEFTEVVIPGSRHVRILNPVPDSPLQ